MVRFYLVGFLFIPLVQTITAIDRQEFDCSVNATSSSRLLSRKKRYLAFPSGSAFVATITLLKAIQLKEPSNWNLDLEFDMIWPIPNQEKLRKRPYKRVKNFHRTRRHKRDLYSNIELALMRSFDAVADAHGLHIINTAVVARLFQGLPGKECVLRAICEANTYLNLPGVSFIDDILRVILSHEDTEEKLDHYDRAYRKETDCAFEYPCPISILDLLLNYNPQPD